MSINDELLQDIEAIDWTKLTHAYGSAEDVPVLFRHLLSPKTKSPLVDAANVADLFRWLHKPDSLEDGDELEGDALDELSNLVFHQMTLYQATAVVIPFLLRLIESPGWQRRDEVLELVGSMAESAVSQLDRSEAVSTYEAVKKGLGLLQSLLRSEMCGTRLFASCALSCFPSTPEARAALLAAFAWEVEPNARTGIALALVLVGEHGANILDAIAFPRARALVAAHLRLGKYGWIARNVIRSIARDPQSSSLNEQVQWYED